MAASRSAARIFQRSRLIRTGRNMKAENLFIETAESKGAFAIILK